jgi:hypothetical protein
MGKMDSVNNFRFTTLICYIVYMKILFLCTILNVYYWKYTSLVQIAIKRNSICNILYIWHVLTLNLYREDVICGTWSVTWYELQITVT